MNMITVKLPAGFDAYMLSCCNATPPAPIDNDARTMFICGAISFMLRKWLHEGGDPEVLIEFYRLNDVIEVPLS